MSKRKTRIGSNPLSWITNTKKKFSHNKTNENKKEIEVEVETTGPQSQPPSSIQPSAPEAEPQETIGVLDKIGSRQLSMEEGLELVKKLYSTLDHQTIYLKGEWAEAPLEMDKDGFSSKELLVISLDQASSVDLSGYFPNHRITTVTHGDSFAKVGDRHFRLDTSDENQIIRLLAKDSELSFLPDQIVVFGSGEPFTTGLPQDALRRGVYPLFFLARELLKRRIESPVRMLVVAGHEDRQSPFVHALGGLSRTVSRENPLLSLRTVFLPDVAGGGEMIAVEAGAAASADVEILYRDGKRFCRRLSEVEIKESTPKAWDEWKNGVYLITGASGGLGLLLAKHLSTLKGVKLVLTDLREPSEEARQQIKLMEKNGTEILFHRCDITDRTAVLDLVKQARQRFGAIDGVIHSAGVNRDAFLINKTGEDIAFVVSPKILGALALHDAFEEEDLRFFILFSSLSAVLGSPGQSDYAYANSFLDHFAHWRDSRSGGMTVSINWPYWEEGGMRVAEETRSAAFERTGLEPMPTTSGVEAFSRVLNVGVPNVTVAYGHRERLLKLIFGESAATPVAVRPGKTERLPQVNPEELLQKTTEFLKNIFCELLKLSPQYVGMDIRFEEFGIDSIMINMFNSRIDGLFRNIPKTLLFEYQTLRQLSDYFAQHQKEALLKLFYSHRQPSGAEIKRKPVERPAGKGAPKTKLVSMKKNVDGRQRLAPALSHSGEGIAVIGLSGRYPGARDVDTFWENIAAGKDCIGEIPINRWDYRPYYDQDPANGKIYCKWGGFIDDIDRFDPLAFNISPREAANMDPQERLFLQASRDALQDAGYNQRELQRVLDREPGPGVGVFAGVTTFTYQLLRPDLGQQLPAPSSIANRVSFVLNLNGPSMPVDTACSSSLTAIHMACESIRRGECRMAIAGGVNLYLHPAKYLTMSSFKMLSPEGKCKTFSAGADGFVPGEGVGAVLLKPLIQAEADHDYIYGVIKGTAVNHGGRTNGYSVPSPNAQGALIGTAHDRCGIDPRTISYVEAHGTGTSLGDPIEIAGLMKAYGPRTSDRRYCAVGSVKTNIGHLESAAGIAALTKVLLQMKHRRLAPSLHADELNPKIDFENSCFYVQRSLEHWQRPRISLNGAVKTYPRRASISSFGAWGANAHVIVEEYQRELPELHHERPAIIVLSGRNKEGLETYARTLNDFLWKKMDADNNSLPGGDQRWKHDVAEEVTAQVARILSIGKEEIGRDEDLAECGFEPMHMMNLVTAVNDRWKLDLSMAEASLRTSIDAFTDYLYRKHGDSLAHIFNLDGQLETGGESPELQLSLADIAFTLQIGREPLDERLAFVVSSMEELRERLGAFCGGSDESFGFKGNARDYKAMSQYLLSGEVGDDFLELLLKREDYNRIAQLWVTGTEIDWSRCYPPAQASPNRIPLPVYPLAGQRYWVEAQAERQTTEGPLHPLLDSIHLPRSMEDGIVFQKRLEPEDPIIRDHQVAGRGILPGVGYLEIAYAALSLVRKAGDFTMRKVILLQPLAVEKGSKTLLASLKECERVISFEIKSLDGGQETLHARGEFQKRQPSEDPLSRHIAIRDIETRCNRVLGRGELYGGYDDIGISYGPFFQGVEHVRVNGDEAMGELALSPSEDGDWRSYLLHPTLMDGALQTLAGLVNDPGSTAGGPMLPFAFDTVEWMKSPGQRAFAYVKKAGAGHRYHVAIVDEGGDVCVRLRDVTLREMKQQSEVSSAQDPLSRFFYAPAFVPKPLPPDKRQLPVEQELGKGAVLIVTSSPAAALAARIKDFYPGGVAELLDVEAIHSDQSPVAAFDNVLKIYFLGGIVHSSMNVMDLDCLNAVQHNGVSALFKLVKDLGAAGCSRRRLSLSVVTNGALSIGTAEINPLAAALHGFTGSMAKEYTAWDVNCLDIDVGTDTDNGSLKEIAAAIVGEPPAKNGDVVAFRNGLRYERKIELLTLPALKDSPFKERGVYVIAGGAGGIGLELTDYLAREAKARVVLLGRSPASGSLKDRIAAIEQKGGQVMYVRADLADPDSVRRALEATRERFGAVNGVIHSAIVLRDRMIENMDEETLEAALAPKVRGSVTLYNVFKDEPLDFMMFFSSAQAITCNAGQSNYAAGCTFKDAFAHFIDRHAQFPVRIVNWGYWGSVGIVSSDEYNQRLASRGIVSIMPEEGMEAVRRIVAAPVSQVIPIKADTGMLAAMGIDLESSRYYHQADIPSILERVLPDELSLGGEAGSDDSRNESAASALQEYMGLGLLDAFRRMGVFMAAGEEYSRSQLFEQLRIIPRFERLYHALLDILSQNGYIECENDLVRSAAVLDREDLSGELANLENKRKKLSIDFPEIAPHLTLLAACLKAYPDVLPGGVDPMSVMFPQGSMELVEDVYKGNDIVDFNNQHMAAIIGNAIKVLLKEDPSARVRVLEVGAGTGGTSGLVCSTIAPFAQSIDYVYTDISKKFAQHGKTVFGSQYPFMQFTVLDIEKSPENQGFATASFDIVLATNVIHATQEIGVTLGNIKQLLKTNGLLLVNEATKKQDFGTLTFGLTEGWWLFRDDWARIPGTPLISVSGWKALMEANGFRRVRAFGLPGAGGSEPEQSVIVAEGDGGVLLRTGKTTNTAIQSRMPKAPVAKPRRRDAAGGANVETIIVNVLARVIHIQPSQFDPDLSFQDYGVDSLLAVEIIDALNEELKTELRPTDLFNYATIRDLAGYIGEQASPPQVHEEVDVASVLRDILAEVIHIDSSQFDLDMSFQDYGVDSLLAVEVIDKINGCLDLALQPTDLFNYATLRDLANYIAPLAGDKDVAPTEFESEESPPDDELFGLLRQLEDGELSTDDAERLLEGYHG